MNLKYREQVEKKYETRIFYNKNYLERKTQGSLLLPKCTDKRCMLCKIAEMEYRDVDAVDGEKFCKVYNCVYKLRCNICNLAYVGQTSGPFNIRFNNHKSDIRKNSVNKTEQQIEIRHFSKHGIPNIKTSVLKVVKNEKERKINENKIMASLGTVYPYGLNVIFNQKNVLKDIHNKDSYESIYEKINHHGKINTMINHDFNTDLRSIRNGTDIKDFIVKNIKEGDVVRVKNIVFNIKKKNILDFLEKMYSCDKSNSINVDICIDLIKYRIKKQGLENYVKNMKNGVRVVDKNYLVLDYTGDHFRDFNINKLINKHNNLLPIPDINIVKAYRYDKTFGRIVFNYNSFAKNIKKGDEDNVCYCNESSYSGYVNPDFGHILTGNLDIVKDTNLKHYMSFGTKYRIKRNLDKNKVIRRLDLNLDMFISKIAQRYVLPEGVFQEWKFHVLGDFKKNYSNDYNGVSGFYYNMLKSEIKNLQKLFIVTYVDKANTNYAIICKKFYREQLIHTYENKNNYVKIDLQKTELSNRIKAFYRKFKLPLFSSEFPYIVLVPKFHKNPVSFRAITCGYGSYLVGTNKKLLAFLNIIFDLIQDTDKRFIVKNSFEVIERLKLLKNIKAIQSYDFEDLYNSIQLSDLEEKIRIFYNGVNNHGINRDSFFNLFTFVIKENYLYNGNKFYKQIRGIPMGGSCSSILADIYLYTYELKVLSEPDFIKDICIFRYIDDILVVKYNTADNDINFNFYPKNLNLKPTFTDSKNVNYLDIYIEIKNNNFFTDIYDKRNSYSFKINRILHFSSSVHISVFRNIFLNSLRRIDRLCAEIPQKVRRIEDIYRYALTQGYPRGFLNKLVSGFCGCESIRSELKVSLGIAAK